MEPTHARPGRESIYPYRPRYVAPVGGRPDRVALWAFVFALFTIVVAIVSAAGL